MNKKRVFIAIVLILLSAMYGYYLFVSDKCGGGIKTLFDFEVKKCAEQNLYNKNQQKDETVDWKMYRNEEYGFEVKYPGDWFIEESENENEIVFLRTNEYKEKKASDCCPYAIQKPGDEDKIVKVYKGEILISLDDIDIINKQYENKNLKKETEVINLNSVYWKAYIDNFEGILMPKVFTFLPVKNRYLSFNGGLESERTNIDIKYVSDYNFMILKIVKTFKFIK